MDYKMLKTPSNRRSSYQLDSSKSLLAAENLGKVSYYMDHQEQVKLFWRRLVLLRQKGHFSLSPLQI